MKIFAKNVKSAFMDIQPSQPQNNFTPSPVEGQPEQPQKPNKKLIAAIVIVLALLAIGAGVYFGFVYKKCEPVSPPKMGQSDPKIIERDGKLYFCESYFDRLLNKKTGSIACTKEARECPDGSYVGRTGPNCEFAACPTATSTITVLLPNGGESWQAGSVQTIKWSSQNLPQGAHIRLWLYSPSLREGPVISNDISIVNNSYSWTVGSYSGSGSFDPASDYKLTADVYTGPVCGLYPIMGGNCSATASILASDTSDAAFSIAETASWQTYQNEQYKYVVTYPTGWKPSISLTNQNSSPEYVIRQTLDLSNNIWISVWQNLSNLQLSQWLDKFSQWFPLTDKTSKTVTNENLTAICTKQPRSPQAYELQGCFFQKGNYIYRISYSNDDNSKSQTIYNQILSTFKFTP